MTTDGIKIRIMLSLGKGTSQYGDPDPRLRVSIAHLWAQLEGGPRGHRDKYSSRRTSSNSARVQPHESPHDDGTSQTGMLNRMKEY